MREVVMNDKSNLLQLEEHFYQLVDVDEPNTFRNLFPYEEIPKIAFNDRIVPHNMPDEIWITDTTFRDGQQSRAPYTTEQIVTIYDYLHKLGGPKGKIRQSEFFLYSKKDRDAVYKCMERGYQFPEVTSWIRASKQDFQLVKDLGLRETGILVSCSDYHIFYKMKMTRREVMNLYLSVIRDCLETGISPRCHLEDITRSDIYGFVIPFCVELMKLQEILTEKIFAYVREHPQDIGEIRQFLNYYLPTTIKLLEQYVVLQNQGMRMGNIDEGMRKIESMLDKVIVAFQRQLDGLFESSVVDITADIQVMEQMMASEGLTGKDF